MNFILRRTSEWYGQPCKEAIMIKFQSWHTRTCTEKEYNERFSGKEGGLWRSKGKNHAITKEGYITRQEEDIEKWGIEIKTLEELLDFVNKYGKIVVAFDNNYQNLKIEIYDNYRE